MVEEKAGMGLDARASAFRSVLSSAQITDAFGKRLQVEDGMSALLAALHDLRHKNSTLFLAGNGGSAAVASHAVTDFVNVGKVRATTLHDPALLTCMANDYGYEAAFAKILDTVARRGDALVCISSSGRSKNMRNAAAKMRDAGVFVMTLSGFDEGNPLRAMGDLNVWLDSSDYGFVEIGHQFVLHNLADRLRIEDKK